MTQQISYSGRVPLECSGQRLDQVAVQMFPDFSRSRLQEWIKLGDLTLAGVPAKVNTRVEGGETINLEAAPTEFGEWQSQEMPLDIQYEDDSIIVINKPVGLVVHPAAGNYEGTLLNGLLHYLPNLVEIPRAGIVHRLDKDTSGLMVVAKTLQAQANLVAQMQDRSVSRHYLALVQGACPATGTVDAPMGRDPKNRKKMAVVKSGGKEAITHFSVKKRYSGVALVELKLETGRTHQIRVHMAHFGFPLVGDTAYGKAIRKSIMMNNELRSLLNEFPRQALHAYSLALNHPTTGERVSWQVPLPQDLVDLLAVLDGAQ